MNKSIYSKAQEYLVGQLKKARKESGMDQIQVAKRLGKTQSYISKAESGQRRIDVIQLMEFAVIYKKKLDYFIRS